MKHLNIQLNLKENKTNGARITRYPCTKENELNLDINLIKTNSKWLIDINAKSKTRKLLEDNMEENLDDLGYGLTF